MQAMIDLLICLRRHEWTARTAAAQMSPRERTALRIQLDLVRDSIPEFVLGHYERVQRRQTVLDECPAALAMATLVSAYQALPPRKRHSLHSFFDLATYSSRQGRGHTSRRPSCDR
jgi:hypothetical protein